MSRNSERAKGAEIPAVFRGQQTEGYDDKKDCFLVYMPAEQERCISTEGYSTNKGFPRGFQKEFDQAQLFKVNTIGGENMGYGSLTIWKHRVNMKVVQGVTLGRTAKAVSPTRPLVPLLTAVESTARPIRGATVLVSLHRLFAKT